MIITVMPSPVIAVEADTGLCEHHTAHTDECGYREAKPGHPCDHVHTEDCFTDKLICGYDENTTTTVSGSDTVHSHTRDCYKRECPHERGEHDGTCGYAEAVESRACGYVCGLCTAKDKKDDGAGTSGGNGLPAGGVSGNGPAAGGVSGNDPAAGGISGNDPAAGGVSGNDPATPGGLKPETIQTEAAESVIITVFDGLDEAVQFQSVPAGTKLDGLLLPATLGALGYAVAPDTKPAPEPEAVMIEGVTWQPDSLWDEAAEQGSYTFTPVLPEAYVPAEGAELPEIYVMVGERPMPFMIDPDDTNADGYHDGDVAVINAMIDNNKLNASKDSPTSWRFALWLESDVGPSRIISLNLNSKYLSNTLNLSGLTDLATLNCGYNKLTGLEGLGGLTKLKYLNCNNNQLTRLEGLGNLKELLALNCSNNPLNSQMGLEGLSNLTKLNTLKCSSNQLQGLEGLGTLTNLHTLNCSNNPLNPQTGLAGLGNLTGLTTLECDSNQLTSLEGLSNLTKLNELKCNYNQLTSLAGLGSLKELKKLECYNNQLTELEGLGSLTKLTHLQCAKNQLTGLEGLSSLTNLKELKCGLNLLTGLDVSPLTLTDLNCNENPLTSFKLSEDRQLTVGSATEGTVKLTKYEYSSKAVTLKATAAKGYIFKEWTASGTTLAQNSANPVTFTLDGRIAITPVFESVEDAANRAAVAAAKTAIEGGAHSVAQASAGTEEALKTALADKINALPAVKDNGVTVTVNTVSVTKAATAGDADDADGTDGSFSFTVSLSKGKASGTASSTSGTITATAFIGQTNAQAVAAAKTAIEGGPYTVAQSGAGTEEALKIALVDKINALSGMRGTGITVQAEDITINTFTAAKAGDADDADGTDGSFSFTVSLSKGKASGTASSTSGTITATAFIGQTNAQAVAAAKTAIEGGTYTVAQSGAGTEEALKTALADKINALSGMRDTGITVQTEDITINTFTAAKAGDADDADGTDGSFSFTVSLSKGKATGATSSKSGTITATAFIGQTNAQAVAAAKTAIEGGTYTVAQSGAGTEEALKTALVDKINALSGMRGTGITVQAEDITINTFTAATAGDGDDTDGTDGSFSFTVSLSKGKATGATSSKSGTITATAFIGQTNAQAVAAAKTAIEGGPYTVAQASAGTEEALKTALADKINALPAVKDNGVTVTVNTVSVTKAATAGDADDADGTDGSFSFAVSLSKGKAAGTASSTSGTITATAFIGQTNAQAVAAAKTAIEGGTYTVAQAGAGTEEALKTALADKINALSGMRGTGITVQAEDITINTFTAAKAGDGDDTDGTDGSFSFTVSLSKGKGTGATSSTSGTITATAFIGQTNAQAVAAAKTAIEGGTYTMAQAGAGTEEALKTALADKINALSGMRDTGITVMPENITVAPFTAATAGDADDADGTDGSFSFTVSLSKGKATGATSSKNGTITATAFTGQTNAQAVAAAKAAITGSTYTIEQAGAGDETALKSALAAKINALSGMRGTGITVQAEDITINTFTAAKAGDADDADGTDGSFSFTVSLSKGAAHDATVSKNGTISATAYTGQTNAQAVAAAKTAITGSTYTIEQAGAGDETALKSALADKINALSGMRDTGVTVQAEDITINTFTAAKAGDADDADGTDGSFSFTVALSKGAARDATASKNGTIAAVYYISSDATLSGLSVTGAAISPAFDPAINSYTASVGNSVSSVTVTAAAADSGAAVTGDTGVKALAVGGNTFTVTVTAADGTRLVYNITITRAASSGESGSLDNGGTSGSSGKAPGPGATVQPLARQNPSAAGTVQPLTPDKEGGVTVKDDTVSAAISAVRQEARRRGYTGKDIAVSVPVRTTGGQPVLNVTIPAPTLDKLVGEQVARFELTTSDMVSYSFSQDTLKQLDTKSAGSHIVLRAEKEEALTGAAGAAVGSRPVYDITMVYLESGKEVPASTLDGKTITIKLPYTPGEGENTGNLCAVYVDDAGTVHWLTNSAYDVSQEALLLEVSHFSVYGVGSRPVPAFTDTAGHWAKTDIDFAASRGLLSGTGKTTFKPNDAVTRGMFVAALGRLAGIDAADYPSSGRIPDVSADAYYAPYAEWAVSRDIVNGAGEKAFRPDEAVTREQLADMMYRYAKAMACTLPEAREAESFLDADQISGSMKNAVQAMQQAGIMNGKGGRRFGPKSTATRGEAAAVLRRFVGVVIDPAAAQGWTQNDAGRFLYYQEGKPVIGWKQIGDKWYYFYPDGTMAVSTKIDGCEIGPDGTGKKPDETGKKTE